LEAEVNEYEPSLHVEAVRAMLKDLYMDAVMKSTDPRKMLVSVMQDFDYPPDWMVTGLACQKDEDILPYAIQSYLLDWRPE
jgi:hypothetical protein